MRPWSVVFSLLFVTCECGGYEDAKELISSFGSVVNVPLSRNFKKTHRFLSFSQSFLKRSVPFAELLATALKAGLEEDQLNTLLTLTNGIDAKVESIARQQIYIHETDVYRDLLLDYDREVTRPIFGFLQKMRFMSKMRMNVSHVVIDTFTHECNGHLSSPTSIAKFLATLAQRCAEPHLPSTAAIQLFDLINTIQFEEYTLTTDKQHLFFRHFTVLYFWLSSRPEKSSVLLKFAEDHRGIFVRNKPVLLELLMDELGIEQTTKVPTSCLPKAAFVAHGYKRDAIEHFGDLLMEHVTSLEYVTVMCANISFYGRPDEADIFTLEVGRILEPIYGFIRNGLNGILESTWPTTESLLIRNIMQDLSKGTMFPETNETYERILDAVHDKMTMIGHPFYRRQYVVARERKIGPESRDFAFACSPRACTNSSTMDARCVSIRTQIETNKAYEMLQGLIDFTNSSSPVFFSAMDGELYSYSFVERAVQILATKYGLDFNKFTNHSSYVLFREKDYFSGCSNAFAMKCDEDLDNTFLQTLHYHEDGTKFTDCEDWLVLLGF